MKEETKSKFIKYGKRAGFGVALVSLFLLGVGVGACSARKAVGSSAEDIPVQYENDLLAGAEWLGVDWDNPDSDGHFLIHSSNSYKGAFVDLTAGLYAFSYSDSGLIFRGDVDFYNAVVNVGRWHGVVSLSDTHFPSNLFYRTSSGGVETSYVPITETGRYYVYTQSGASLYLVDGRDLPPSHVISFPDNYNPFAGFGTPSDGLIGQLSGSLSSPFRLDLAFSSGGQMFKRIDYYFLPMQGTEYVSALNTSGSPSVFTGSGFFYASMINYIAYDNTTFLAWRAIFGTKSDGTLYLRNFGEWASKQYQTINVVQYTPVYGQSGVAPNLDQIGILELRTASGVPTPIIGGDNNADVFSLLSTGFSSVAGLLNIQILPFLTLGTLIFVPLVVMVIFAILKVLNK